MEPRTPEKVLDTLKELFPNEVRDVREAGEGQVEAVEKQLAQAFFLQPRLSGRILPRKEEAGLAHVLQGRGWPEEQGNEQPKEQPPPVDLAAVFAEAEREWKTARGRSKSAAGA